MDFFDWPITKQCDQILNMFTMALSRFGESHYQYSFCLANAPYDHPFGFRGISLVPKSDCCKNLKDKQYYRRSNTNVEHSKTRMEYILYSFP